MNGANPKKQTSIKNYFKIKGKFENLNEIIQPISYGIK